MSIYTHLNLYSYDLNMSLFKLPSSFLSRMYLLILAWPAFPIHVWLRGLYCILYYRLCLVCLINSSFRFIPFFFCHDFSYSFFSALKFIYLIARLSPRFVLYVNCFLKFLAYSWLFFFPVVLLQLSLIVISLPCQYKIKMSSIYTKKDGLEISIKG